MTKKFLVLFTFLFLSIFVFSVSVKAAETFENYEDEDGNVQYGWHLEAEEINREIWDFDENGNPKASRAAEGDTSTQFTNNYAIRNLVISAGDSYTTQATFIPDPDSDLSVERAYGLLVWYQDPDNFLLYWVRQKANEWSANFYGRVGGTYRSFYITPETKANGNVSWGFEGWDRSEFADMWWDSLHPHPSIRNKRDVLLGTTLTLKVVSDIENVTVGGVTEESRFFEFYHIIDGTSHLSAKFYVKNIDSESGDFYTGIFTEAFNVGISDYALESETNFAAPVNESIAQLPATISTDAEMANVIAVASDYKSLLSFKSGISEENRTKIEALDASVISYVDGRILGLDENKTTFVNDTLAVEELFYSLPIAYQDQLTQVDALIEALEKAEGWEDPTLVKPVVEITTAATAHTGDEIEVKYNVSDNLTAVEDLIITVEVKKGVTTKVELTDNKFVAQEGKYTIKVIAEDEHGNKGSATLMVEVTTLDTEKPSIEITTADVANEGDLVEVKYNVTDNVSNANDLEILVSVAKNGSTVQLTNNKFTAEVGIYTITISAKDAAGNIATASKDVVVASSDTTKPTVTITVPTTASVGEEVLVTYTATDDTSAANKMNAVIEVTKDGAAVQLTNNRFTAEAGTYNIKVTVTDEAGNSTVATSTVTVAAQEAGNSEAGCGGSVVASVLGILALGAMAFAFGRKKKEF